MAEDLFDIAREQFKHLNPFVLYRKPFSQKLRLLIQSGADVNSVSSFDESGFIMAPYDSSQPPLYLKPDQLFTADQYKPTPFYQREISFAGSREAGKEYINLISRALREIKSGALNKVVVSRKIDIPLQLNPLDRFNNLLLEHSGAFCYFWYHPATGIWTGATPELFLSVKKDQILTYALAGTKVAHYDSLPEWTDKEKQEQRYVTDFILEQLRSSGLEPIPSETLSIKAGQLWHLKTEIKAKINGQNIRRLILKLHPTPAVCGTPKKEAIAFLQKNEDYDRGFYTGYLGEFNLKGSGECDLFVNLRCMSWEKGIARVYVGGGITQQSVPKEEWLETEQKSHTIINALFNYQE